MKRTILFVLAASLALVSCRREEVLNPESVITLGGEKMTDFDKWLDANYVTPYNIQVKYRFESNESDLNYWTVPAELDCSILMAHLVKYLCIDSYDEVAGARFTQKYFPKEFFYIGEWEYKNNGSYILGTAEGGKKILLSGLNYLPQVMAGNYLGYKDPAVGLNHFYIKTIHHEFTHILNQTKDFPVEFTQVTPTDYVTESWNTSAYGTYYRQRGFVTTYAQHSAREDFAEVLSMYVTNPDEVVQGWLEDASREVTESDTDKTINKNHFDEFNTSFPGMKAGEHFSGDVLILAKIAQVRKYMAETFNIDIDALRAAVLRRQAEVVAGEVDLTSLEVK